MSAPSDFSGHKVFYSVTFIKYWINSYTCANLTILFPYFCFAKGFSSAFSGFLSIEKIAKSIIF